MIMKIQNLKKKIMHLFFFQIPIIHLLRLTAILYEQETMQKNLQI